jgi:microcystin-dependent protein
MTTPYIGEIRLGGWTFAPAGWALCNGQLVAIDQNPALFQLIGTTYGGDGMNTFALPDLQGRVPLHVGTGFVLGQKAGAEQVTLTGTQYPAHPHQFYATLNAGTQPSPPGNAPATLSGGAASAYIQSPATAALAPQSIGPATGGGAPHENRQPYLGLAFIIALTGIFPSPS